METNNRSILARVEKAIVREVLTRLRSAGFLPVSVSSGGEDEMFLASVDETVDAIFEYADDATVRFKDGADGSTRHWVLFVLGNGEDILSDYGADGGHFQATVDKFLDEFDAWFKAVAL
jgi:hypothetical protein